MEQFFQTLLRVLTFAMAAVYVLAGLALMALHPFGLSLAFQIAFGALLLIYGLFRIVRSVRNTAGTT
jgi:hypothetical protein